MSVAKPKLSTPSQARACCNVPDSPHLAPCRVRTSFFPSSRRFAPKGPEKNLLLPRHSVPAGMALVLPRMSAPRPQFRRSNFTRSLVGTVEGFSWPCWAEGTSGQEKACTGPDHLGRVRGELTFGGLLCWLGDQDYSGLRPSPFGPPARCACVGSATLRIRTWGQPLPQSAAMLESAFFPKQGALCGAAVILRSSSATQRSGKMRPNPKGPAGFGPWRCCATGPVAQATEPAPRLAR